MTCFVEVSMWYIWHMHIWKYQWLAELLTANTVSCDWADYLCTQSTTEGRQECCYFCRYLVTIVHFCTSHVCNVLFFRGLQLVAGLQSALLSSSSGGASPGHARFIWDVMELNQRPSHHSPACPAFRPPLPQGAAVKYFLQEVRQHTEIKATNKP